ncbi:tyrosine-type recombinase/integrase [Actinomadura decatromicini]|uniref:Tyrosine-type recombinase/integrase n=2 Tax=Actinomadura decatromicini TaxID=2604572 RepID=A0A5D3FAX6_9ACTN|nr:tyrosine-type recombinase/integrase [Actinomadura decatromicini]
MTSVASPGLGLVPGAASVEGARPAAMRVRGTPPARTPGELASLLRAARLSEKGLRATAVWLVSGRRESDHTRAAYVRDVGWWAAWCAAVGVDVADPPTAAADLYMAELVASGLARSTIGRRVAAVSSWYTYLIREQGAAANPFDGAERPRLDSAASATRGLSRAQVTAVLAHAAEHETARTHALLWLMFATAGRIGSLLSARIEHLGQDRGHQVIDLTVKGGMKKRFAVPPAALHALDRYLAERGHPESGLLFVTRTGRALGQPYAWKLVNRIARATGVTHAISPHTFRHTAITIALSDGKPLHVVQDFAGHADPRTTRRYDRARDSLDRSPAYELAASIAPQPT